MLRTHPDSSTVDVSPAVTSFTARRPGSAVADHPDHQGLFSFGAESAAHATVGLSGSRALHLFLLCGLLQPVPGLFGRGDLGEEAVGHRTLTRHRQPRLLLVAQREYVDHSAGDLADGAEGVGWRGANSVDGVGEEVWDVGDGRELSDQLPVHHVTQQALQVGDPSPLAALRNRGRAFEERTRRGGTSHFLLPAKLLLTGFHHGSAEAAESVADFRRYDEFCELLQAAVGHRGRKRSCRQQGRKKIKVLGKL